MRQLTAAKDGVHLSKFLFVEIWPLIKQICPPNTIFMAMSLCTLGALYGIPELATSPCRNFEPTMVCSVGGPSLYISGESPKGIRIVMRVGGATHMLPFPGG